MLRLRKPDFIALHWPIEPRSAGRGVNRVPQGLSLFHPTRQTFSMFVPPGYPIGSPQVIA